MSTLFDLFSSDPAGEPRPPLRELRLSQEPVFALAFTAEADHVSLHYESDDTIRSYYRCPGRDCPVCYLGSSPTKFGLLPLANLDEHEVQVLRVATTRGPGSLADSLLPALVRDDLSNHVLLISRNGNRFRVDVRPLGPDADRCSPVIDSFLRERQKGLSLATAFPLYTPAELADVPRIRRKLDALGGYEPPSKDSTEADDDGDH